MLPNLHPNHLAAAYDCLREFPPFDKWGFPHSDEVKFTVDNSIKRRGWYCKNPDDHIGISERNTGHLISLILVMAHEMLHLKQEIDGTKTKSEHNANFKELCKEVCDIHGWDLKLF